ncbi:MAG: tannase/feruloyl esterase family alpha/beta hydrolase [Pseudonocardiales bacterium]|nr:MAG: tannase/feruloyl esterase family alpha/beta hydrolase [Pseudonocardiales bacterium]
MLTRVSVAVALILGASLLQASTAAAHPTPPGQHCGHLDVLATPGAEHQETACLADLTTAGTTLTGHTNPDDWAGLHAAGTINPTGVPGVQIDGYFPDTSTGNTNHGWNHDSQFVIRLPDHWNGGLVITGAPGVRRQYADDFIISDSVLAKGYAFAATDKGNTGATFYRDGVAPGDAIAEWNSRVTQLTVAAKRIVQQRYGLPAWRTIMTGISNGGYLTRWQLENRPDLYDGGVDWEGTLFRAGGPNLLTYLPAALRNYSAYKAGSQAAHDAIIRAGFAPGSEFLWDFHYTNYWDLTQRIYREELDPAYDGALEAGIPFCASGTPSCDADYDYFSRPSSVRDAVAKVQLTGRIGRPMLTLHGTLDTLLPPATDSDVYDQLIRQAGRGWLHRYYRIEGGNHVDGLYSAYPTQLRPILPCYRTAFDQLVRWVSTGRPPSPSGFVPKPATGDVVNSCALPS